jgi:hypothetical protein
MTRRTTATAPEMTPISRPDRFVETEAPPVGEMTVVSLAKGTGADEEDADSGGIGKRARRKN